MQNIGQTNKSKTKLYILATAIVIICAALIGLGIYLVWGGGANGDAVKAPSLVGHDILKAKEIAKSEGLNVEIDAWLFDKTHPINQVLSQKPLPGEPMKKGDRIIVKVSSGNDCKDLGKSTKKSVAVDEDLKPLPSPPIEPNKTSINQSNQVIVIDAGHQSHADLQREPIGPGAQQTKVKCTGGTSGVNSRTPEYRVTLDISVKLKAKLEAKGFKVIMTREKNDVDLSNVERASVANNAGAALFVRIHADGDTNHDKSGVSTLYPASNSWTAPIYQNSVDAARLVQKSVVAVTNHKDNGIVARNDITGFNWSKVPVILVETGFMTNPGEDALLNSASYQDKLAEGVCEGIVNYMQTK